MQRRPQRAVQLTGPHGARSASLGGDGKLRFCAGAQPAHGKAQIQPVLIAYDEGELHLRLRPAAAGIVARDGGHSGKGVAPRAAVGRGSHFHLARSIGLIRPRHALPDADAVDPGIDPVRAAQGKLVGKDALLQLGIDHALPHPVVRRAYDGARLSSIFIPGHNGKEIQLRLVLAVCPCILFLCDILRRLRAFGLAGLRIVRIRSGGRLVLLIRLRLALRPALLAAVFLGLRRDRLVNRLLWRLFSAECTFPVQTRGTNMSTGINFSTDAVPLAAIYQENPGMLPPPNSPWAALDGDYGLELMGYMSRIAELPGNRYLFRYYIHDPWWVNSPWYDRYGGQPHDIYLPLACTRIDESGHVQAPTDCSLLSIDNSFGERPDSCVNEPVPHMLKAIKDAPDAPSPFVWVYPFREYNESTTAQQLNDMFSEDWFVRNIISSGFPLCTIVSTDNFLKHDKSIYRGSVLVTPVPAAGTAIEAELLRYADWNYYERTPQMDALTAFLMNEGHQPRRDAEEIAGEIQYACVIEADMEQIYDILSDYDMELDGNTVEAFVKVMMSVKNNTRLWANKGYTPNELAVLYYRGAPTADGTGRKKIGRNDPCPCGSGKKFKKCCGR